MRSLCCLFSSTQAVLLRSQFEMSRGLVDVSSDDFDDDDANAFVGGLADVSSVEENDEDGSGSDSGADASNGVQNEACVVMPWVFDNTGRRGGGEWVILENTGRRGDWNLDNTGGRVGGDQCGEAGKEVLDDAGRRWGGSWILRGGGGGGGW